MIRVERRGGVVALSVGTSSLSSSGSTIGRAWDGQLAMCGGLLCVLVGEGRRSWMWMWGVVGVLAVMYVGMVSTLGDGASGGQLNWRVDGGLLGWFATWRIRGCAGGILGLLLDGRLGGGSCGLQLLTTTVSSSSPSSSSVARIWNGLLLRVWRWWTNGICWMTLGVVMLFDVVATLGGLACPTL
jgi:hypothetical protein